ncbi:MAG TPA: DUF4145 domain-containing protein [Polyangia bacterium]|nr:DUF4145 domain-containing protein [Polyangia bacterium]
MMVSFQKASQDKNIQVNFDCPWCDTHQAGVGTFLVEHPAEAWLVVIRCASALCDRPILLRVPFSIGLPWQMIDTTYAGCGDPEIYPAARPEYDEDGVPDEIACDFEEALQCQAAGFLFGAALVGRRVLQAAVRDRGGKGKTLEIEIDSLPIDVLNAPLKGGAHEIRLVGNRAAHANDVTAEDVQDLLGFTRDVLHSLYVVPTRVAARKKPASPPRG